jgi:hypothetical protein
MIMKTKNLLLLVGTLLVAGSCFALGACFGKARRQPDIVSLESQLRSERIRSSNVENRAAGGMRSVIAALKRDEGIENACRDLNNRIDLLLVHQTVEYRQGISDAHDKLTFNPYDKFWFQTAYDIRKDREQYPVTYESSKWESQIKSILETEGPVLIKRGTDRTTDSTVPSEGAPSDVQ